MSTMPAREKALGMYRKMFEIRQYEEIIKFLFFEGIMPGTIHQSAGEEACAVGVIYGLRKDDIVYSTHRPAGHDIAKGIPGARDIDDKMADARRVLDWDAQFECALDPETAKAIRDDRSPEHDDTCSMCGKFCAVRSMNKALNGEHVDIL